MKSKLVFTDNNDNFLSIEHDPCEDSAIEFWIESGDQSMMENDNSAIFGMSRQEAIDLSKALVKFIAENAGE